MRYIPFHETDRVDHWHILDTETREVAVWHISATSAQREADELNARPDTRNSMTWTEPERLDEGIRLSAQRVTLRASDEFWAEAELVATAAGYCEVYDRIAAFLGGPAREGSAPTRRYYSVEVMVSVDPATGVDSYEIERATLSGLDSISGLRYYRYPVVTRKEDPNVAELRKVVEAERERRAQIAASEEREEV